MNGKLTSEELETTLAYYAYANSFFSKTKINPAEKDRVFNVFLALNELKELRKKVKELEYKHDYDKA